MFPPTDLPRSLELTDRAITRLFGQVNHGRKRYDSGIALLRVPERRVSPLNRRPEIELRDLVAISGKELETPNDAAWELLVEDLASERLKPELHALSDERLHDHTFGSGG
jgi:hypothetical protein